MRYFLVISFILASACVLAKEDVKNFNKVLIENVKKDISKENDDQFKVKTPVNRGPASVRPDWTPESDSKIDKNVRQIGPNKW